MRLTPLAAALGTLVEDIDLSEDVTEVEWSELLRAFRDRQMLCFPGQSLSGTRHMDVLARFGAIVPTGKDHSGVSVVSNEAGGLLGTNEEVFHMDYLFDPTPPHVLSLHALELPPSGTVTWFANAVQAAADLTDEQRARIGDMQARQIYDTRAGGAERLREKNPNVDFDALQTTHPLLWPHRDTGAAVLAIDTRHTDSVVGLEPAESDELLGELRQHSYADDRRYDHHWKVGDLLIWDNLALQHGRPASPREIGRRRLQRVVAGDSPAALRVFN